MLEIVEVPIAMSDSPQLNTTMCLLCSGTLEMLPMSPCQVASQSPLQVKLPCSSSEMHAVLR